MMYIYGLPDSEKAYFEAYQKLLKESNLYTQCSLDPCLYYRTTSKTNCIFIIIYVDDTLVFASHEELIQEFINLLENSQYDFTIDRNPTSYLGLYLEDQLNSSIKITQPKILKLIFEKYLPEINKINRKATAPMRINTNFVKENNEEDIFMPPDKYMQLLGSLNYVTKSRPDILGAVSFAATKGIKPSKKDYEELLYIVKYLKRTENRGLVLHKINDNDDLQLKCYVDASYLIHPDSKSHSGYTISFGDIGIFYAKSIKQKLISTSSTHAETRALASLVQDIVYIVDLCKTISFPIKLPAIIFEDNNAVKQLVNNQANGMKRCKHFLMLLAYIKEQLNQNLISVVKIPTKDNKSDILTKPVVGQEFENKAKDMLHTKSSFKFFNIF